MTVAGQGEDRPTRHVVLPDGRAVDVRPVQLDDLDGLEALYAGLDLEDQYRRFFTAYHPRRAFLEHLATMADRGGFGLVAVVRSADGTEELVGECGYSVLPNGDGELGITVAAPWRGWLGPYLLDTLLSVAADRGVPNLEAEVLVANGPMLALARSRDCVVMDHPDLSVVRVLIGTAPPSASWPGRHDRPRILVEGPGTTWHQEAARAAGLEVVTCPGPSVRRQACPALSGRPCPLAAGADAIVVRHPVDEEPWSELVASHQRLHAGVPVCVEARRPMQSDGSPATSSERPEVVRAPAGDGAEVVAFVEHLARRPR
jgi:RimJ/RimL family protein N-acetyltransferase